MNSYFESAGGEAQKPTRHEPWCTLEDDLNFIFGVQTAPSKLRFPPLWLPANRNTAYHNGVASASDFDTRS